jgi:hypothetical protein
VAADVPLALQTLYAELVDRAASDAFDEAFAEEGTFVPKTVRGRRYWYFQMPTGKGRVQRYVGPETPELLDRIKHHKRDRQDRRDRQTLVSTLVRSGHLPSPQPEIGEIVAALARAGVFRLRGVLVGTSAYQAYAAMLGARLPVAGLHTEDVDIAQFAAVSVAVGDQTPSALEILREVDASFRPVSEQTDNRRTTKYRAANGLRVDFLTPNRGPDTDQPASLPAFHTDAAQLRFLDFLIRDPEPAVLHGTGIYVTVPAPQRYAIHKLIVARRRRPGAAKSDKDVQQAASLLEVLIRKRPHELRSAWTEAYSRGPKWRKLLGEGLALVTAAVRDATVKVVGARRSAVDGLDLVFSAPVARYDSGRDVVLFRGEANGESVRCAVSLEAFEDFAEVESLDGDGCLAVYRKNRSLFEKMARLKYLEWPIEQIDEVLIKSADLEKLREQLNSPSAPAAPAPRKGRGRRP